MKKIGIIGVGLLGTAVTQRLLAAGFAVSGHDTRSAQTDPLRDQGLVAAMSLADAAAGVDAVFTILPTIESVTKTILDPGGLLDVSTPETVLVQMSTISPTITRKLAEVAAAKGRAFLDAPISGTSAMVARGDCTIFVGGDPTVAETCRPVFDAIARKTVLVGSAGMASLAKLATNLLVGLNTAAVAEALVLGRKGGLDPAALLEILRDSAASSRMLDIRGPLMVAHRFEPQMKVELFVKDFKLMLDEGLRLGVPLPLTSLTQQLCVATAAAGRGGEDLAAVIATLEHMAGLGR